MLTVVFATHNGEPTLPRVLDAHARLEPPPGGWRLVVVDNASTDATPAILAEHERAGRLPLTVLREPAPGKNRALNAALDVAYAMGGTVEVEGDLVVFTDDDVLPEPDWLVRLRGAADRHRDRAVFGGTIRPEFPHPPPSWLAGPDAPLGVLFAATDRRDGPCPADRVWGPNMAVRAEVFQRGLRFDASVGPGATAEYPMGSETEFTVRLQDHGYKAWFVEDAVVRHIVRPRQMTEAFAVGRAYRHGLGVARYQPGLASSRWPRVAGIPVRLLPRIAFWTGSAALARLLPPSRPRFRAAYQGAWWRGVARYLLDSRAAAAAAGVAAHPPDPAPAPRDATRP